MEGGTDTGGGARSSPAPAPSRSPPPLRSSSTLALLHRSPWPPLAFPPLRSSPAPAPSRSPPAPALHNSASPSAPAPEPSAAAAPSQRVNMSTLVSGFVNNTEIKMKDFEYVPVDGARPAARKVSTRRVLVRLLGKDVAEADSLPKNLVGAFSTAMSKQFFVTPTMQTDMKKCGHMLLPTTEENDERPLAAVLATTATDFSSMMNFEVSRMAYKKQAPKRRQVRILAFMIPCVVYARSCAPQHINTVPVPLTYLFTQDGEKAYQEWLQKRRRIDTEPGTSNPTAGPSNQPLEVATALPTADDDATYEHLRFSCFASSSFKDEEVREVSCANIYVLHARHLSHVQLAREHALIRLLPSLLPIPSPM